MLLIISVLIKWFWNTIPQKRNVSFLFFFPIQNNEEKLVAKTLSFFFFAAAAAVLLNVANSFLIFSFNISSLISFYNADNFTILNCIKEQKKTKQRNNGFFFAHKYLFYSFSSFFFLTLSFKTNYLLNFSFFSTGY